MAIREILLPLVSYPVAVDEAAIKKSVSVAAHLDAQITAVSFEVDSRPLGGSYTRPFPTDGLTIETPEHKQSLMSAEQMMAVFDTAARASASDITKQSSVVFRKIFLPIWHFARARLIYPWSPSDHSTPCTKKWSKNSSSSRDARS
jgi:hypothetical protein